MKVTVEPPFLTINHGSIFMVSELDGQIQCDKFQGIFADDTRFLSEYACFIDNTSWMRLTSSVTRYYASKIYLTNPAISSQNGEIAKGALSLTIARTAEHGIHEDLDITNHSLKAVKFHLDLEINSDFADIFEVQSGEFVRRGQIETDWDKKEYKLRHTYNNGDFYRCMIAHWDNLTSPPHYANGRVTFQIELEAGASWHACCCYTLIDNEHCHKPISLCYDEAIKSDVNTELQQLQRQWQDVCTTIATSNEDLKRLYCQSLEDMSAMRLYDYDMAPDVWLPAAGVPKYVALFGRDSLTASLQNQIIHPGFARGALQKLGQFQAKEYSDWQDAQPGKILHELRQGELVYLKKSPRSPYYGAADTTPLYTIVLHETWKWLGDDSLLKDYRDVALRCLDWIDRYGDLDKDGFQEYQVRSEKGIENQCWKDSGDSIVYPDGSQVKSPKALCELQGYVFDAWMRMAEVFEALGEKDSATELQGKAEKLRVQFEERFWCEDLGFYALTLDPDKQPVRSIASNPGHCLWSGIVSPERAQRVVKRLLEPDMSSGWGIRTLSSNHPSFNPFSYHLGSVWPHDNGIIALGFKRYGSHEAVASVAADIFETASHFACYQIPEVYAGTKRQIGAFPVPYIEANIPQAWAAGSVFHLIQALLGLQANAPHGCLYVDPYLPDWLPDLTLCGLEVGDSSIDLRFWREGDRTCWDASVRSGTISVQQKAWQPWAIPVSV
ncbi:amylo-alpha-1,6-glucosidase [Laspinema olomoucense]|uniref:amylo-alpha-1,6-glucosidase n=1 Tax=Laspinema olomoucense TaxID=3231600 RepID=UPI0021BB652F|nr:glycogen debranching N-terminal domain-containing protein [Laspinema sp. D3a]MCT7990986.1 hypothetical protein [Laspinema sp. D3a]